MHSIAVASILAAAATLTAAAPSVDRRGAYYVCWNNGFRGDCSVDPCALSWCPDYKPYTYEPASKSSTPEPVPAPVPAPVATKQWYVCANNNFRGECTVDPCAISWCPDYKPYTYEPKVAKRQSDPTVCAPGTGYFQSCSNGFRGCCKSDACGSPTGWCPDNKLKGRTPEPAPASDPTVCAPGTGYFQSCSNGFRGCCKSDACGSATGWCPDQQLKERTPEPAPASDPTVCAPGTGFFQSCSNGFRGCCKTDACSPSGWCADYKKGTYEPVSAPAPAPVTVKPVTPAPAPATVPVPVDGVCSAGTGFFQVCANGFKGCCKADACTLGYCPN